MRAQKDKVLQEQKDVQWDSSILKYVLQRNYFISLLRTKADLYDNYHSGRAEYRDSSRQDDDGPLVDFERKIWDEQDYAKQYPNTNIPHPDYDDYDDPDMFRLRIVPLFSQTQIDREMKRKKWAALQQTRIEEEQESNKRFEKRMLLNQIVSETQVGRDKVLQLQDERCVRD